jgi:hypothetical protein
VFRPGAPSLAPEPLLPLPLLVDDREEGTIAAPSLLDVVLDEPTPPARVKSLGCRCSRAAAGEALKLFISFVMTFSLGKLYFSSSCRYHKHAMSVSSCAARAPTTTSSKMLCGGGRIPRASKGFFCRRDGVTTFASSSSSREESDRELLDKMKIAVASATSAPTAKHVLEALKELSSQEFGLANVKFTEVMAKIDELYDHNPQFGYSSGVGTDGFETENKAGTNMGSNKVFYFAKMHDFTEEMTLRLFCEHYQDVLDTPEGQSHLNIRSFMKNGWAGIRFEGETLRPKGEKGEGEKIDQI